MKPLLSCTACPLYSALGPVWHNGSLNADLALVGQNPGPDEIDAGEPFVGSAGRILDTCLHKAGISRASTFVTNAVKCFVPPGQEVPAEAIRLCKPLLDKE